MIEVATATRVRLHRGRHVHSIRQPVAAARQTGCGKFVHLFGPRGGRLDELLADTTPVTCPGCQAAEAVTA